MNRYCADAEIRLIFTYCDCVAAAMEQAYA